MGQPRPILIQPHYSPTISPNQGDGLPKILKDLRPVRFVAVECEGTPEAGVPPHPIGVKVDDVDLAHRFQV
jgi:hypothetical protein